MANALALAAVAAPATAVVAPPVTIDGPSPQILDFGNAAMAADGSGGLVYVKMAEGEPHVFASRLLGGHWSAPIRVDWDQPFDGGQPRIAAGTKGELIVVWVTQVATIDGQVRRGLFSARLGPGADSFGPSLLVDPNVGDGTGVDPSLSLSSPGSAIVAYRVITQRFAVGATPANGAVQLRPGDVMADIRLARLGGGRWARLGAVNRNPAASMRPPSSANAPQVAAAASGNAVVAWQEPDQTRAARIWARRVFGGSLGTPSQISPSSWEGQPVLDDADSLALDVTGFDRAQVAARVDAGPRSTLGGPRIFVSAFGPNSVSGAGVAGKPQMLPTAGGVLGSASVAAADGSGGEGRMLLAFLAGGALHAFAAGESGGVNPVATPLGPPVEEGEAAAVSLDPAGGGVLAYPAQGVGGEPVVAVRQEFPSGSVQTSLLSGIGAGPVAELSAGRSGGGDAAIGFRQGEPGAFEIVADRVGALPAPFRAKVPARWLRPPQVKLSWSPAASASGRVTYGVLLDGRLVCQGLRRLAFRPRPALLGGGTLRVRVVATDAQGQQLLTKPMRLRVDDTRPAATVRLKSAARRLTVRVRDAGSGLRAKVTRVSFGDGSVDRGGSRFAHAYAAPGAYFVQVRARDRVGNGLRQRFAVRVR